MVGANNRLAGISHPTRQSPRKPSHSSSNPSRPAPSTQTQTQTAPNPHLFPTPLSNSPSTSSTLTNLHRFPPQFDHPPAFSHAHTASISARTSSALYTPRSPYRPGEYARADRKYDTASERTKIERRLFGDDEDETGEEEEEVPKRNRGSSPLQPAFEARLILRKGAPVDLISWLRRNFHHIPSPSHPSLTSSTSLLAIRALLAERFPRLPESDELVKAVTAAFPRVHMDYGPANSSEPPMIRGLVWNGKETVYEEEREREKEKEREKERRMNLDVVMGRQVVTPDKKRGKAGVISIPNGHSDHNGNESITTKLPGLGGTGTGTGSRSPTQSTLVSPTSSAARKLLPNTPARSVLEEFAVLATLADKTPAKKTQSLPGEIIAPAPAYALASICDSFGTSSSALLTTTTMGGNVGNRPRSSTAVENPSSVLGKRRTSTPTPDKLEGLLAAAETIEGSPMTSFLDGEMGKGREGMGHKRRRTIGGLGSIREIVGMPKRGRVGATGSPGPSQGGKMLFGEGEREMGEQSMDIDNAPSVSGLVVGTDMPSTSGASTGKKEKKARGGRASTVGGRGKGRKGKTAAVMPDIQEGEVVASDTRDGAIVPGQIGTNDAAAISTNSPPSTTEINCNNSTLHPFSSSSLPNPISTSSRPRKANELPTEGLYPGIDCKPPHPYHDMIRHAIESAPDRRLQLSQIYSSIAERFPFFAALDERKTAGWQNSIRHNLSLKKMFVRVNKVDGVPDEGGKGGWWTVEPGIPDEGRPGRKTKTMSTSSTGAGLANGSTSTTASTPTGSTAGPAGIVRGRRSDGDLSVVSGMVESTMVPAPAYQPSLLPSVPGGGGGGGVDKMEMVKVDGDDKLAMMWRDPNALGGEKEVRSGMVEGMVNTATKTNDMTQATR